MAATPDLATLQRWMQAVIEHPACVHDALACEAAEDLIPSATLERVIKPSATLDPAERIGIYHGMYLMRMVEALESDYPTLRAYLGEDRFTELTRDYVQVHPSTSTTLNRLGDRLPEFALGWAPRAEAGFLHDLARLELAVNEVFDAEESPIVSAEDAARIPQEAWTSARLVPTAAFRLVATSHPVTEALSAFKKGLPVQKVRRRAAWTALYRQGYTVTRLDLTRPEHEMLSALASGTPLGSALEAATASLKSSERPDRVFGWFRTWLAQGMFTRVEI